MSIKSPFFPIVYVRGFAATMTEIEDTVATPYMGFNLGATKIRQNHKGNVVRFIFESPLIRLMKDEGYADTFANGDLIGPDQPVSPKSLWIFRYYEPVSEQLGTGQRRSIEDFAADLRDFILNTVRERVCGDDPAERAAFRVYLVAHSMGGLICRCYLQNLCVHGTGDAALDRRLELPGDSLVDKVFTYATPHNGIDFQGINVPNLGALSAFHVKNFNRNEMRRYLALPQGDDPVGNLNGSFPPQRFFCLVGTNYWDYSAFAGLSRHATGPMSDGLVMIRNATVAEAPRAFVHRSHSGHFGIVNSEEGYQNLRRFLFGQIRVDALLQADEITLPPRVQELKDAGKKIRASYQIETTVQVRNAGYFLHERRVDQASAIFKEYDEWIKDDRPVYLFSTFLDKRGKAADAADTALAFAVRVAVQVPLYEVDNRFWFDEHYEGGYLLEETLTFHVRMRADATTVRYGFFGSDGPGKATRALDLGKTAAGGVEATIALGFSEGAARPPRPGFRGLLKFRATPWNG